MVMTTQSQLSTEISRTINPNDHDNQTIDIRSVQSTLNTQFDDPTNASGLGSPAILRGTVYAHLAAGVTKGAGQTQAVQTATLTGLQNAINYAGSNNKFFEIEPNTYEIYGSAGLVIPVSASNFLWRGSLNSIISQFYVNAPILTVGAVSGTSYASFQKLSGFTLNYGVSQTGNTSAIGLQLGACYGVMIDNWDVCGNFTNAPYIGVNISSANTANGFFFQCAIRDGHVGLSQKNLFGLTMNGTGNLFENLYLQNGSNAATRATLSGPAMNLTISGQASDNVFSRINLEHFNANSYSTAGINMSTLIGATFIDLHVEDVLMAQNSSFFYQVGGQVKFINTEIYNMYVSGGSSNIFGFAGYGETQSIDGLLMRWDSVASAGVTATTSLIGNPSSNDTNPSPTVDNLVIQDDPGNNGKYIQLDTIMTQPLIGGTFVSRYTSDNLIPRTNHLQLTLSAAYTHYGMHEDAVLFVPASITSFTISLSNKLKPSGTGSSLATKTGTVVRIRRSSGTASGTLTVTDVAGSTTLATNTTSATDLLFTFNGTNWIVAT